VTPAQIAFAVALGLVTVVIAAFAAYVVSSTMWSNRWYRGRDRESE